MNAAEPAPDGPPSGDQVDTLRSLTTTATQRLLGDTIAVSDEDWRRPSRLAGWSRGHVATHLARQADALLRLVDGARAGRSEPMYRSPEQRDAEIEAGAGRSGLDLQIDLDTSAGALSEAFEGVEPEAVWDRVVELRGGDQVPVRLLPLARLCEVVLHQVDLDVGLEMDHIDGATADWLLEWLAVRLARRAGFPRIRVLSDSGVTLLVGHDDEPVEVRGPSTALLGWLTGRRSSEQLQGADGLALPPF